MFVQHIIGLFTDPTGEWEKIREQHTGANKAGVGHVFALAAIPAVANT